MMSHGILTDMLSLESREEVASKASFNKSAKYHELTTDHNSAANLNNLKYLSMCLHDAKVILDKTVVSQYLKTRKVPSDLLTSSSKQTDASGGMNYKETKLEADNSFLVKSENCTGYIKNRLSGSKDFTNGNMLNEEKEVILEGPIYSQKNNLFDNINEYIAQQSIGVGSVYKHTNTQVLHNRAHNANACYKSNFTEHHNLLNDTRTMSIEGECVEMECGDDILFTHGGDNYDENVETTDAEPSEMECGDDILFMNDADYDENPESITVESDELECGDDILFTEGAGYYDSDEDSVEEIQEVHYGNEDVHEEANLLNGQTKEKIVFENVKSAIKDTFQKQENEIHYSNECHYQKQENEIHYSNECHYETFDKQELDSHVATHQFEFSNIEDILVICEKCGESFQTLSLLKEHQQETHGLRYFYTCKFCPSTSWYSDTLKNHIETVHRKELDKENIDDIMKNIKQSKQKDQDHSNGLSSQQTMEREHVLSAQVIQKTTKKPNKRKFIDYIEAKQLLKVFCSKCNGSPPPKRKRILQHCLRCNCHLTYKCRKCGTFYFTYNVAYKHAKWACETTKSTITVPKKIYKRSVAKKSYYNAICLECDKSFERKERNIDEICLKCKTYLEYQCEVCQKFFKLEITARRHSQICHKKWSNDMINASLATLALVDHNYYCKDRTVPKVNEISIVVQQPPVTEVRHHRQAARKVYSGKKNCTR